MALTLEQLQKLLDGEGLRYFVDPKQSALLLALKGANGSYQCVASLQEGGRFLQLLTLGYATCAADHPHASALFRTLAAINAQRRFTKFAWDPRDGTIIVFADVWVMDGAVTQEQFHRICSNYFTCLDDDYRRIKQALETGEDPGPEDLEAKARRLEGEKGGLPDAVRKALDKIRGKKPPEAPAGEAPAVDEI